MPHPIFEIIRERYLYACGYCTVTETSAGGNHTLDHYKPRAVGGNDEDDNLVYACIKCNQYKGDFWPSADDLAKGHRVLHPLFDNLKEHIRENGQNGYLEPLTETGRFHIALLRLNRPQLIHHRLARRLQQVLQEKQSLLEQQITELRKTIEAQERYIAFLEARQRSQ
jgi:hypothetical protein